MKIRITKALGARVFVATSPQGLGFKLCDWFFEVASKPGKYELLSLSYEVTWSENIDTGKGFEEYSALVMFRKA